MKNKMADVRNHLIAMLEELGDPKAGREVVERAKATSLVAGTFISAVKCEMDAIRLHDDIGRMPMAIDAPTPPPQGQLVAMPARSKA